MSNREEVLGQAEGVEGDGDADKEGEDGADAGDEGVIGLSGFAAKSREGIRFGAGEGGADGGDVADEGAEDGIGDWGCGLVGRGDDRWVVVWCEYGDDRRSPSMEQKRRCGLRVEDLIGEDKEVGDFGFLFFVFL